MFSVKFASFLRTSFFTEQLQCLLLRFNSCFQRSPEQKPLRLSALDTKFSWKKVFVSAKIEKLPPSVFCKRRPPTLLERGSSIAKFLRTPIFKNICEWLLQKQPRRCSVRKDALRNFAIFTGKYLYQSPFFNKVAGLRPATLLKKRLRHRCFPVNFANFLRTLFLKNTSGRLSTSVTNLPKGGNSWFFFIPLNVSVSYILPWRNGFVL